MKWELLGPSHAHNICAEAVGGTLLYFFSICALMHYNCKEKLDDYQQHNMKENMNLCLHFKLCPAAMVVKLKYFSFNVRRTRDIAFKGLELRDN